MNRPIRAFAFKVVGAVVVAVHGERDPADDEWDAFLSSIEDRAGLRRQLIVSDGGGPNTLQRGRLHERLAGRSVPVAFVSDATPARRLTMALSWSNPSVRLFAPRDLLQAFAYLDMASASMEAITRELDALRRGLAAS